jgi:hypothetical protein
MSCSLWKICRRAGQFVVFAMAVLVALPALAGIPAGGPLGTAAGNGLSGTLPVVEGGILALVAGGVVGGVWLVRRKR